MAEVDVGLPIPLGNYSYLPPVQTGVIAPEEKAMNLPLTWLAGQGIDLIAEKTGIKDVLRERGAGILDMIIPQAQAAESTSMPPVQTGFQPTTSVVAQDATGYEGFGPGGEFAMAPNASVALGNPVSESPLNPSYNQPAPPTMQITDEDIQATAAKMRQMAPTIADFGKEVEKEVQAGNVQPGGFFDTIKSFLGDEERMAGLAIAFNSMRLTPDASLAAAMEKRIERAGDRRKANRTADALLTRGLITPEQAEMIRMGIPYKDVMGGEGIAKYRWLLENPEEAAKLKEMGVLSSGTNITIGDKGETKLQEEIGKGLGAKITEDFNAGTQARSALDSIDLLMGLSENLEAATSIPPALRNLVPEGVSDPIDAYRGVMTNVAKSLRIKGEGTMSDRDIDLLIRQAGPVTSNPQARRVMQEALKRKAEINLQLSKAASDFMLDRINRQQYLDRVNEINNIPLMDERMRSYISSLGGGAAKPAGGQVKVISVE